MTEAVDLEEEISILIICENPRKYRLVMKQLSREGWRVACVSNVKKALQMMLSDPPTHVFVSYNVEGISVDKVAKIINTTFKLPVILFPERDDYKTSKMMRELPWPHKISTQLSATTIRAKLNQLLGGALNNRNSSDEKSQSIISASNKNQYERAEKNTSSTINSRRSNRSDESEEYEGLNAKKEKNKNRHEGDEDRLTENDVEEMPWHKRKNKKRNRNEELSYDSDPKTQGTEHDYEDDDDISADIYDQEPTYKRKSRRNQKTIHYNDHSVGNADANDDEEYGYEDEDSAIDIEQVRANKKKVAKKNAKNKNEREEAAVEDDWLEEDEEYSYDAKPNNRVKKKKDLDSKSNSDDFLDDNKENKMLEDDEEEDDFFIDEEDVDESDYFDDEKNSGQRRNKKRKRKNNKASAREKKTGRKRKKTNIQLKGRSKDHNYDSGEEEGLVEAAEELTGKTYDDDGFIDQDENYNDDGFIEEEASDREEAAERKAKRAKKNKLEEESKDESLMETEDSNDEDEFVESIGIENFAVNEDVAAEAQEMLEQLKEEDEADTDSQSEQDAEDNPRSIEEPKSDTSKRRKKEQRSDVDTEEDDESTTFDSHFTKNKERADPDDLDESDQAKKRKHKLSDSGDSLVEKKETDWDVANDEDSALILSKIENALATAINKSVKKDADVTSNVALSQAEQLIAFHVEGEYINGIIYLCFAQKNTIDTGLINLFLDNVRDQMVTENISVDIYQPVAIYRSEVSSKSDEFDMTKWIENHCDTYIITQHKSEPAIVGFSREEKILPEIGTKGEKMLHIDIASAPIDEKVEFELFLHLPLNEKYIKYIAIGGQLEKERHSRLIKKEVRKIYFRKTDIEKIKYFYIQKFAIKKISA